MASIPEYKDVVLEIKDRIGIIRFNRPAVLNNFGGQLIPETISALRHLDTHPSTIFTILTGTGRFFSSGADVKAARFTPPSTSTSSPDPAALKLQYLTSFTPSLELLRSLIDHTKILVLALNGPGVGGGAAWFPGVADLVFAAQGAYLQTPFSALGLVPEQGSAVTFASHIGVHRTNEFLMFGTKLGVEELKQAGMVNRIFPAGDGFQGEVVQFLEEQLRVNDGKSMMEVKRLQNLRLRDERMTAVANAVDALAERFVDGEPIRRFKKRREEMEAKSKEKTGSKL